MNKESVVVSKSTDNLRLTNNGERRSGIDRRQFSYTDHIPERRAGEDRRSGLERRCGRDRRVTVEAIAGMERRRGSDRRGALSD